MNLTALSLTISHSQRRVNSAAFSLTISRSQRRVNLAAFSLTISRSQRRVNLAAFSLTISRSQRRVNLAAFSLTISHSQRRVNLAAFSLTLVRSIDCYMEVCVESHILEYFDLRANLSRNPEEKSYHCYLCSSLDRTLLYSCYQSFSRAKRIQSLHVSTELLVIFRG